MISRKLWPKRGAARAMIMSERVTLRSLSREAFAASGLSFTYTFHDTPFGEVIALVCDGALAGLGFSPDRKAALADMQRRWPKARFVEEAGAGADFVARIFNAQNKEPVPLLLIGGELDRAVWQALLSIPAGSFTSYGALAEKLGKPKAARAIGGAVGRNPVCVAVPCHRVRGKDGAPTGYHWGLSTKQALLDWENKQNIL